MINISVKCILAQCFILYWLYIHPYMYVYVVIKIIFIINKFSTNLMSQTIEINKKKNLNLYFELKTRKMINLNKNYKQNGIDVKIIILKYLLLNKWWIKSMCWNFLLLLLLTSFLFILMHIKTTNQSEDFFYPPVCIQISVFFYLLSCTQCQTQEIFGTWNIVARQISSMLTAY